MKKRTRHSVWYRSRWFCAVVIALIAVASAGTLAYLHEASNLVTNSFAAVNTVDIPVEKVWVDENNTDGLRPSSVTVELWADGTATGDILTLEEDAAGDWKGSFTGQSLINSSGDTIAYSVQETSVPNGYTAAVAGDVANGFTVTNTHEVEDINISGSVYWVTDGEDDSGYRPGSVTLTLYADGVEFQTITVSSQSGDTWVYSVSDLPKYADGKEITYTIGAQDVSRYGKSISGYDVTYTFGKEVFAVYSETDNSLRFYNDVKPEVGDTYGFADGVDENPDKNRYDDGDLTVTAVYTGFETETYGLGHVPWYEYYSEILITVVEDEGIAPISLDYWFAYFGYCTSFELSKLDTSQVRSMEYTFYWASRALEITCGGWDTSQTTNMQGTFMDCVSLPALDVSRWNTSSVTNLHSTFDGCMYLESLDVSAWDTSNVTTMAATFAIAYSLTTLDLNAWDTSQVTTMRSMFSNSGMARLSGDTTFTYGDAKLTTVLCSSWDTSQVTDMSNMFRSDNALSTIDVSHWDTSNVTNMADMFHDCNALMTLDLSGWDTSNVTDMSSMFRSNNGSGGNISGGKFDDSSLTTIYVGSGWSVTNVSTSTSMFWGSTDLVGGAGTQYNTDNPTDKTYARIDDPDNGNPGYLTDIAQKTSLHALTADEESEEPGENLSEEDLGTPGLTDETSDDAAPITGDVEPVAEDAANLLAEESLTEPDADTVVAEASEDPPAEEDDSGLELSELWAVTAEAAETGVTYHTGEDGFVFSPGTGAYPTDLFSDLFKDMMPGDTATDTVAVTNAAASDCSVNLYLRSLGGNEEMEDFLSKLTLTVTAADGAEIFNGSAYETDGLTEWTLLGNLAPGAETTLTLTLSVPAELDNAYADLTGVVTWEFMAEEIEDTATPAAGSGGGSPAAKTTGTIHTKTGDVNIGWIIALLIAGGVALTALLASRRRAKL